MKQEHFLIKVFGDRGDEQNMKFLCKKKNNKTPNIMKNIDHAAAQFLALYLFLLHRPLCHDRGLKIILPIKRGGYVLICN